MPKKTDIEDDATWNFDAAERRRPVAPAARRAIVSVAIPSEDLETISRAAQEADMKVSEFIRLAAIEKARQSPLVIRGVTFSMGSAGRVNDVYVETQGSSKPNAFVMEAAG